MCIIFLECIFAIVYCTVLYPIIPAFEACNDISTVVRFYCCALPQSTVAYSVCKIAMDSVIQTVAK